jgi:hypothetical protein
VILLAGPVICVLVAVIAFRVPVRAVVGVALDSAPTCILVVVVVVVVAVVAPVPAVVVGLGRVLAAVIVMVVALVWFDAGLSHRRILPQPKIGPASS